MKSLLFKLRDWLYKQHCKKCSCYDVNMCGMPICHSGTDCKYQTWFLDELFKEDKEKRK